VRALQANDPAAARRLLTCLYSRGGDRVAEAARVAVRGAAARARAAESDGRSTETDAGPPSDGGDASCDGAASPRGRPSLSRPSARPRPPSAADDRTALLELAARLADARTALLAALAAAPAGGEGAAVEPVLVSLQFRLADAVARACRRQRLE